MGVDRRQKQGEVGQKIRCMQNGKASAKDIPRLVCVSAGEFCPYSPSYIRVVPANFDTKNTAGFGPWRAKMAEVARVAPENSYSRAQFSMKPSCD